MEPQDRQSRPDSNPGPTSSNISARIPKHEVSLWTDSLGRPLTIHATRSGEFFHTDDHTCCLVGCKPGCPDYLNEAQKYIQQTLPSSIVSLPGLSYKNIDSYKIKLGPHAGNTVSEFLKSFKNTPYSACIFGSNNDETFLPNSSPLKEFNKFFRKIG